ncbi:MAG: SdrD B-like domain-containing protein, partial [Acidobacteriota bacterium]
MANTRRPPRVRDFIAVWTDFGSSELVARYFDTADEALGPEFVLGPTSFEQGVAHVGGDRFLVAWFQPDDGDSSGVQGQLVDYPGATAGSAFQINSFTAGAQDVPSVAGDAENGRVLAAWESSESPGDDDSDGSVLARLLQLPAEVGDFVFGDGDFDGLQGAGEAGLGGVAVSLLEEDGQLIGQTSTGADGSYVFYPFLDASDGERRAFLRFVAPDGLSFTTPDAGDDAEDSDADPSTGETSLFDLRAGQIDGTRDAGLAAGIGNRIWLDADGNGIQDGGEEGLAGVIVELLDGDGVSTAKTASDAEGTYTFTGVETGLYAVRVIVPAGFETAPQDRGDDDVDSDVNASGVSAFFIYLEGSIRADLDAGLVPESLASVGDRVWLDANLNGVQDGGEAGFEGAVVQLYTASNALVETVVSDADGVYLFEDLADGDYYLRLFEPSGFCFTARDRGGDDAVDSDVDPQSLSTAVFSLAAGVADPTRDAGLVPDASVGNRVWLDDGDGIQAGGEPGLEDVTVRLFSASDALVGTTTTDASGYYAFSPGSGDFYLEFVLPAGMAFAPPNRGDDDASDSDVLSSGTTALFTLGPGLVDTSRDAGLEPAVIGNRVWLDANADGRQQPAEVGLPGVTVRLLDEADAEVAATTTGADGLYQFLGVATGSYRIEVELPADGVFSSQNVGANTFEADLIDSDVDPATGRSEFFDYAAESANRRWDAGLRLVPLFADGFESGQPQTY